MMQETTSTFLYADYAFASATPWGQAMNISEGLGNATVSGFPTGKSTRQTVINSSSMFAFGVFSNLLAFFVLARSPARQQKSLFYLIVFGLVSTDFLGIVATSPVVISVYVNNRKWIGGDILCRYFSFMMVFSGNSTVFIICAMSIERFVSIKKPYFYHTTIRPIHAFFALICAWLVASIIALLPLVGFGTAKLQFPKTWCFFDYYSQHLTDKLYCYLFGIVGITSIIITFVCNVIVTVTLTKVNCGQSVRSNNASHIDGGSRFRRGRSRFAEVEMVVLLAGITLVFSSCWMPLMTRVVINQTGLFSPNVRLDLLTVRLASMNQLLDPWVYILLRRNLIRRVIYLISCMPCRRVESRLTRTATTTILSSRNNRYRNETVECLNACVDCLSMPPDVDSTIESQMSSCRSNSVRNPRGGSRRIQRPRGAPANDPGKNITETAPTYTKSSKLANSNV